MAEKIKYTRKDLKSPDEFISTVGRATAWMKANRSRVIAASVLVVIAAAGVVGTYAYIQRKEAAASRELWPILDRAATYLRDPAANAEEGARLEQAQPDELAVPAGDAGRCHVERQRPLVSALAILVVGAVDDHGPRYAPSSPGLGSALGGRLLPTRC